MKKWLWVAAVFLVPVLASADTELVLNGTGVRKATIFGIEVYKASLFVTSRSSKAEDVLEDKKPKQLEMVFLRDVDEDKVVSTWRESLSANVEKPEEWLPGLAELTTGIGEVSEGEKLTLSLSADSAKLETSKGFSREVKKPGFSNALLKIWLGPRPPDEELKRGLLGM